MAKANRKDCANDGTYATDSMETCVDHYGDAFVEARREELEALAVADPVTLRPGVPEHAKRALEEIKAGVFGKCMKCGCWIKPARLTRIPTTGRCLSCKISGKFPVVVADDAKL